MGRMSKGRLLARSARKEQNAQLYFLSNRIYDEAATRADGRFNALSRATDLSILLQFSDGEALADMLREARPKPRARHAKIKLLDLKNARIHLRPEDAESRRKREDYKAGLIPPPPRGSLVWKSS